MPSFTWTDPMTANELDARPLANWKYRRLPANGPQWYVRILQRSTDVNVRQTIDSGGTNIVQKSPVQGGGTAGTTPVPQTTPVIEFIADPGDEIVISNDNTTAGTPTVDGQINVDPV